MTRTRVPRNLNTGNLIHVKLRHSDVALWVNDSLLDKQFYYRPQLNQLNNYSQYANLWDFYRINKIVCKFYPVRTTTVEADVENTTTPAAVTNVPLCVTAIDYDDAGNLTYADLINRNGAQEHLCTKYFTRTFRPACLIQLFSGGVTPGYKPTWGTWIDCNNASMYHYAIKGAIQPAAPAGIYGYNIRIVAYCSFKGRIN